ncbi:hypothetical protein JAAARDRAFT_28770 [Jaapia argillacea MUCL 33604]|uniref:F-box domain-containing protein n=1 Tax=Jaapia argillacea MUCL 33604 TaxID=933084 RepID=A0A067QQY8_9AGAM|nr:hypothetical protein JAAARDRAFT_28770 [Jaapia argillacea MUCL 33604]
MDTAPLLEYLAMNEPLLQDLTTRVEEAHRELLQLEVRRQQLIAFLAPARKERDDLRERVQDAHQAIRAPILRLPVEVISEIFIACLPDRPAWYPHKKDTIHVVTHVCRRWRQIALSTPSLWCHFVIVRPSKVQGRIFQSKYLQTMLSRSGNLPLSFSTVFDQHEAASDLLLPTIERWQHVRLYGPVQYARGILNNTPGEFPTLETLVIAPLRRVVPSRLQPTTPFHIIRAPCLRTVLVGQFADHSQLILPWSQLTRLTLRCLIPLSEYPAFLRKCPNLVDCELGIPFRTLPDLPFRPTPVVLQHLQTLVVWFERPFQPLLDSLVLPALRELSFETPDIYGHPPISSPSTLLSRSRCFLQKLSFLSCTTSQDEFLECLALSPALSELSLRGSDLSFAQPFLDSFNHDTPTSAMVPQLASLSITGASPKFCADLSAELFAGMVTNRWTAFTSDASEALASVREEDKGKPLRVFGLTSLSIRSVPADLGREIRTRLYSCRNEGLEVNRPEPQLVWA